MVFLRGLGSQFWRTFSQVALAEGAGREGMEDPRLGGLLTPASTPSSSPRREGDDPRRLLLLEVRHEVAERALLYVGVGFLHGLGGPGHRQQDRVVRGRLHPPPYLLQLGLIQPQALHDLEQGHLSARGVPHQMVNYTHISCQQVHFGRKRTVLQH